LERLQSENRKTHWQETLLLQLERALFQVLVLVLANNYYWWKINRVSEQPSRRASGVGLILLFANFWIKNSS